ncbi:hypothetical protein CR194_13355 [Salipaludibacillus keqinensis]|uniref:DUF1850 domain-containing protein n=1 Tax=Salipaludibacillus keqinensis TaxID=2045207 RepID=A0A323TCC6_9BACI|nr:DUF1850 domain-containing protein [Salipaludibacillus keqinensis]PYZ92649.1 hypothetical protein CR194_13355 [Salipaludibacillus keqinensis]
MSGRTLLATIIVIAGTITTSFFQSSQEVYLVVADARTGETLLESPMKTGEELTISWIHSVEKTPWNETYQIQEDNLLLKSTSFQSYGAGVPHQSGDAKTENGMIIYENIDEHFDELSWIHSHDAKHEITVNDETLVAVEDLPHHESIRLFVEKR